MPRVCAACGKTPAALLTCGACLSVRYCDVACQTKHWKLEHKSVCALAKADHDTYNLVGVENSLSSVMLPNAQRILALPEDRRIKAIRDDVSRMSQNDFCNLTAALMAALEPRLVEECLHQAQQHYADPEAGILLLHEVKVLFDAPCLRVLTESSPQLAFVLSTLKGRVSLFEFAVQLSTLNWSDEAALKYLDVFRLVLANTKRARALPNGGRPRIRDSLQASLVCRPDPGEPGTQRVFLPVQFVVCYANASIRPFMTSELLDTGAYTAGDERCTGMCKMTILLFDAVRIACAETLRRLLAAGIDARGARNQIGETPLHSLASFETPDCEEKVQLLLSAGHSLEALDTNGFTPLQMAVCGPGSLSAFDALLAAGADPRPLRKGFTNAVGHFYPSLRIATMKGNVGAVRRLLDTSKVPRGVIVVNERDKMFGLTNLGVASVLNDSKTVEALVEGGADFTSPHSYTGLLLLEATPLDVAIWAGSYRAYTALAAAGAQSHAGTGDPLVRRVHSRLDELEDDNFAEMLVVLVENLSSRRLARTPQQAREGVRKILEHIKRSA